MKCFQVPIIRRGCLLRFTFVAAWGVSSASAVQVSTPAVDPAPRFESTANEVTQIFTVLDRKGRPVSGLDSKDFSLLDDGAYVQEFKAFEQQSETPLHIAVAIDLSGSVQERVRYEIDVSTKFLQRIIRPSDEGWIVGFNYRSYLVTDWTRARQTLGEVTHREPRAGTAFYDAVMFACRRLASAGTDSHRRDVLVVISDGEDNASRSAFSETLQTVLRSGIVVLVVYTGASFPSRELRTLADATGGELFSANTKRGVLNGLARAEQAVRAQYLIAYRPANFAPDGRFRSIRLRVLRDHLRVRSRSGYYARSSVLPK
ncbi:MAG: VWA domain-containing protein [Terriglobales bacterium]